MDFLLTEKPRIFFWSSTSDSTQSKDKFFEVCAIDNGYPGIIMTVEDNALVTGSLLGTCDKYQYLFGFSYRVIFY